MRNQWSKYLPSLLLLGALAYAAGNTVDQGAPGKYGSWPVNLAAGSTGTGTSSRCNALYPTATTTALTANGTACTTPGGASCTIIFASTDFGQWENITITLSNTDGANAITNVLVEWSPDNSHFEVWDSTTLAGLAFGTTKSIAIGNSSRRFLRLEARASSNVTSAVVTITANDC